MLQDNLAPAPPAGASCPTASDDELVLAAFQATPRRAGIVEIVADDLRIVYVNRALADHFGVDPALLCGRLASELPIGRDLLTAWIGMARESWNLDEPTRFRQIDRLPDPPRHLIFELTPLHADARRLCAVTIDEAPPTPTAEDGRDEVHFRHLADAAPALLWTSSDEGERTYFNRRWTELTGALADELIGWAWLERVHPDDRETCRETIESAFHDRDAFRHQYRLREAGGGWRWIAEHGAPRRRSDGTFLGFVGTCFDVTARRRTEERLRENERWYSELIEGTDNLVMEVDAEGTLRFINPTSRSVFGAEPEECVAFPWIEFAHPDDREALAARLERWRRGASAGSFEQRIAGRGGGIRDISWTVSPHRDARGQLLSLSCIGQDITERKRSERVHMIQSQVLESMTEGVTLSNAGGFVLYTNPALDAMFGYEPGELIGQSFSRLAGPGLDDDLRLLLDGSTAGERWQGELRQTRKDSVEIWTSVRVASIEIDGTIHRVTVFEDISARRRAEAERRRLDQRLLEAQKLESLGVLAGGVAHDFNNLLMVILGNANLALQDLETGTPRREDLQTIESAALRAADLTRQMLAYSGQGRFIVESTDLSELVREMSGLLTSSLPDDARLELRSAKTLPRVDIDRSQLSQALINLVTNAAEALPAGRGQITLSTGRTRADRELLDRASPAQPLPEGEYVTLRVEDDGDGMPPEVLARVFDPFFTTKFTGRGLGLAAVLGIVRGHGGGITVDSRPGEGAVVTILLPALAEAEPDAETARSSAGAPAAGEASARETVLAVDDDDDVRSMARRMLTRMGFDVVEASGGREAVEIYRRQGESIDAVLLDLGMPEMDGVATYHALREIDPKVRVVVTSGYGEETSAERFGSSPGETEPGEGSPAGFLQKPFRQTDLLLALDKVLDLRS